jgi:hypothetical protein
MMSTYRLLLNVTFVAAASKKSPKLEFLINKVWLCAITVIHNPKFRKNTSKKTNILTKAEIIGYSTQIKNNWITILR